MVAPERPEMIETKKRRRKRKFERRKFQFVSYKDAKVVATAAKAALLGDCHTNNTEPDESTVQTTQDVSDLPSKSGCSNDVIQGRTLSVESEQGEQGYVDAFDADSNGEQGLYEKCLLPEDCDDECYSDEADAFAGEIWV